MAAAIALPVDFISKISSIGEMTLGGIYYKAE
jgi:hypothetical protein